MLILTLAALLVSLIFAGTSIAGKFLSTFGITPFMIAFIRFSSTIVALLPFIKKADMVKVGKSHIGYFFLMGLTGVFLFNVLFFAALQYTSPISVSLICATNPMIALLASAFITQVLPSKRQVMALVCAFIGVSFIILNDASSVCTKIPSSNFGEFLALAAVSSQVCYALIIKRFGGLFSAIFLSFVSGVTGVIFLFPFILQHDVWTLCTTLTVTAWLALLYIGLIAGAISITLYIYVIHKLGAAMCNMIVFSMAPVFTILLSIILLGSVPTLWHLLGGALVLLALFLGLKPKSI